tara:strand:+ start:221 stop:967 length:747 start_codon:yes stop_codon:yes gene_type:complete
MQHVIRLLCLALSLFALSGSAFAIGDGVPPPPDSSMIGMPLRPTNSPVTFAVAGLDFGMAADAGQFLQPPVDCFQCLPWMETEVRDDTGATIKTITNRDFYSGSWTSATHRTLDVWVTLQNTTAGFCVENSQSICTEIAECGWTIDASISFADEFPKTQSYRVRLDRLGMTEEILTAPDDFGKTFKRSISEWEMPSTHEVHCGSSREAMKITIEDFDANLAMWVTVETLIFTATCSPCDTAPPPYSEN